MNRVKDEVAKNLLFYRKKCNLTQKSLADYLGVKHNAVSQWETGINSIDAELLFKICDLFSVSVNDMFGRYANTQSFVLSAQENDHIKKYRALDDEGRGRVDNALDYEYNKVAETKTPAKFA